MLPAVTLRRPDDLLAVVDVVTVPSSSRETWPQVAVVEESLRLLRNERARLAGLCVNFNDGVGLMAALIVFERKSATVLPPLRRGDVVRIWKQGAININLLPGCNVEQDRDCNVQCVARLHIVKGTVLRLNLIGR